LLGGNGWCPNYAGYTCDSTASAGTYDPASGAWKALPFQASSWPSVWTGSALVVLDDKAGFPVGVTGPPGQAASFDPSNGSWTELPAPSKAISTELQYATLVWTGRQMLAWSGGAMMGSSPLVEAYTPKTK
jgi:streptogramin lyase